MSTHTLPVTCDAECNEQFEVVGFDVTQMDSDVEKTSFRCPHCEHEYIAFYTDAEIRKIRDHVSRSVVLFNGSSIVDERTIERSISMNRGKMRVKMDELKVKMESDQHKC